MNRSSTHLTIAGIIVLALGVLAYLSLYTVDMREQVLVLELGRPVKVVKDPGLHVKAPWQKAIYYDKRILNLDPKSEEVILSDKKRILVDAFARYRINQPLEFFQTVRTDYIAQNRLANTINSVVREILGEINLNVLLSEKRADIMKKIKEQVNTLADNFGLEITDVRLRRADLPPQTSESVFNRMRSERIREAKEFRARGQEKAQQIRSTADRQVVETLSKARKEAEIKRGEADAKATRIYAGAFGKDEEFFRFYRSMQAYRRALGDGGSTTMVLTPDSEFFHYFADPDGQGNAKKTP